MFLEKPEHRCAAPVRRDALQPASPFLKGAANGFGFRFAGQPGHFRRETLDLGVLYIQRHYTMVYQLAV